MFTHLHVHTEYSLLDGLSRIRPLLRQAQDMGMDSLAITDHGNLYGAIEFYSAAKEMGIKPIIGCEVYVAARSRFDKTPADKSPYHLLLLSKNYQGYRNLIQLVTKANLEGFYYKPRMDKELLEQHSEGLVVLSGCPNAEVPRLITEGLIKEAREAAGWYKDVFGDFYLEIQEHGGVPQLATINKELLGFHRDMGLPIVATNDSHYIHQKDAPLQDILICIHTNTNIQDPKRLRMTEDSYYLKSPQEMEALFSELPQAIANTQSIAEMCNLELDFSQLHLPEYPLAQGESADDYLSHLCWEGLRRRFPRVSTELEERLSYELEVVRQTHFANYFLVIWDIASYTRRNNILFGVRGSAAASLALYCLGVTDVDPLAYRLVFERFLNVERKEMPDIDMDFQDDRRDEVISYVMQKYGRDHVAQIITFGTLGAKAAIRDVGRALGMPYADTDRVARLIPFRLHITIDDAMEANPELKEVYAADATLRNLINTARQLEGVARHASTHAAGIVISQEPLAEYVPLQRPTKGNEQDTAMTQYSMEPIARLGLLKMDLLGLVNLTILEKARNLIAQTRGVHLDLHEILLDDTKTFELLSSGETTGIFQLEGGGMRRYIKELKPSSLGDVAAMIALYRPGPMEHISTFIDAKHGRIPIRYPHDALQEILEETYGVIVYQDQVLLIAQAFAGYSLGEADTVRKAMGKKIPEVMRQERGKFIEGAHKKGFTKKLAEEMFNLIEPFAGYAFNKAHSVSYALIAYWTAYFKANYPVEYMVALFNSHLSQTDKVATTVHECRRLDIPVLSPDINRGGVEFAIEKMDDGREAIRFGMSAVKNVGAGALLPLIEARDKGGPFTSIEDMCRRAEMTGLNRRTLESLIKVGALDALGSRGAVLAAADRILALAQTEARLRQSGQATMFDLFGDTVSTPLEAIYLQEVEATPREKQAWEKELLGVYLSENPLSSMAARSNAIVFSHELEPEMAGKRVVLAGQVFSVTTRFTRDERPFLSVTLELLDKGVEVTVRPDLLEKTQELWQEGSFLWVVGKVRVRDEQVSVSCEEVKTYSLPTESEPSVQEEPPGYALDPGPAKKGRLRLRFQETEQPGSDEQFLREVVALLLEYQGQDPVSLEIATNGQIVRMEMPFVTVNCCPELQEKLERKIGPDNVVLEQW